jgi:3-oxoacyl-[acyl-carrier protein] reductase
VDILINNVGGSFGGGGFSESTIAQWRDVFDANVFSVLYMSKAAVPLMQARGWGRIVNIASIWGRESGGGAAYNAAKSAVVSITKSMARDLVRHGILVNCVAPGSTWFEGGSWAKRTAENPAAMGDFVRRELPSGVFTTPEEVASAVTLLASALASGVAGACWVVDRAQGHSNL